ncbi:MAG: hypothetical protein HFF52_09755 [Lawsonibacter sp.]|nr:hypothetical protein [Lawsonibacter sp.]
MLKKSVSCCLAVVLILSLMTPGIYAIGNYPSQQRIEAIKEDILEVTQISEEMRCTEVIQNIDSFREKLQTSFPLMNDYELGKSILMALGDSEDFIATLPREKVIEALDYTSAVCTETFIQELPSGEMIEVSQEEFYAPKQAANASIPEYEQTFGKAILRSTAYEYTPSYKLPGRNYYGIRGALEWVEAPLFQFGDSLVVASTGNIDNNYKHNAYGEWLSDFLDPIYDTAFMQGGNIGNGKHITMATTSLFGLGIYFPVSLYPNERHVRTLKYIYAYYGVSSQQDITCRVSYAHGKIAWTPSFSVDSSGTISFGGIDLQREVFNGTGFTIYHH